MEDEYLKERALDIEYIKIQLLKIIFDYNDINKNEDKNQIIIAHELTPSDTGNLDLEKVICFVTETGGQTSHTAIMAKSLGIPAVVGYTKILSKIKNKPVIIRTLDIDGDKELFYYKFPKEMDTFL